MLHIRRFVLAFSLAVSAVAADVKLAQVERIVDGLSATKMGTYKDDLWLWNATDRTVTLLDRAGQTRIARLPKAAANLDVDGERGIAALSPTGTEIEIYDWNGKLEETLKLPSKAGDIAWIGARQVVVTPSFGAHRAQSWDLDTGKLIGSVAAAEHIEQPKTAGAVRARTTHVRYSPKRQELALIDAFDGTIVIVRPDGRTLRTAKAPDPTTPEMRTWLAEADLNARRSGERFTPGIWQYPTAAFAGDGSVWLAEGKTATTVNVVRVRADGKVERKAMQKLRCVSLRIAAWDPYLIFFNDPRNAQPQCPEVKENR